MKKFKANKKKKCIIYKIIQSKVQTQDKIAKYIIQLFDINTSNMVYNLLPKKLTQKS